MSDLIVRTPAGERLLADLAGRLELTAADPDDMVASQSETRRVKRDVCRGRLWLRSLAGRPLPDYPGLDLAASPGDRGGRSPTRPGSACSGLARRQALSDVGGPVSFRGAIMPRAADQRTGGRGRR